MWRSGISEFQRHLVLDTNAPTAGELGLDCLPLLGDTHYFVSTVTKNPQGVGQSVDGVVLHDTACLGLQFVSPSNWDQ